jgi:beta-glucanase (GH16 family)
MKYISLLIPFFLLIIFACESTKSGPALPNMIWNDEFEVDGVPNSELWSYQLGNGCPTLCGWGNNELEYYTSDLENSRVENGVLVIEVHNNRDDSLINYSSGKIISKHKGDWKYGYFEIRAKLPLGRGTWPAIWMLPTEWKYGDWPKSGEIDIMEHVGYDEGNVHGTVHTEAFNHKKGTEKGKVYKVENPDQFHIYAINWTPDKIEFFVDGNLYNTFLNNGKGSAYWPYDQEYHLLLNVAVGGDWGGREGVDDTIWPVRMEIDYVRVYEYIEDNIALNK